MGWRFASAEPRKIHILGTVDDVAIGLCLEGEEELPAEASYSQTPRDEGHGEQTGLPESLVRFLQDRLRVARLDPRGGCDVFRPLE